MLTTISHRAPLLAIRTSSVLRISGARFANKGTINEDPVTYEHKVFPPPNEQRKWPLQANAPHNKQKRPLQIIALGNASRGQHQLRRQPTEGADKVVAFAFATNACDTICKFGAAYLTGSKSLFAEGVHSLMDTCNQLILYTGIKYSAKTADPNHPYGYGNMRYITSLVSGCGILSFGCGLSIYHGISGLLHPTELEPMNYAFYALGLSFVFQGCSGMVAYQEVRKKATEAKMNIYKYVTSIADPSLNVVLLEDSAAVVGVAIALGAVTTSSLLNSSIPDCIGSIAIGVLLGTVATFIIRTNAAHLVGRSLPKHVTDDIVEMLEKDGAIRSVHDVKATSLGVENSRFKAEIDFNGWSITKRYLHENCDAEHMFEEVKSLKDLDEFERFMAFHGERVVDKIGDEVDRIEQRITRKYPNVKHVDLEAL